MTLSVGIPGATPAGDVRRIAAAAERRGFRALWINDTPGASSLHALAAAAEATSTLGLAAGVVPLDRVPVADIAAQLRELPADRVRLGVGAGASTKPLGLLERGIGELRAVTAVPILVGALGPRSRALAARIADGILFSWLTPPLAAEAQAQLRRDAAGRPVEGVLYARTIATAEAQPALEREAASYAGYPQYAAHFARLGIDPLDTTIDLREPRASVAFEEAVDEVVLRVITPGRTADEVLRALESADLPPGAPV